MPNLVSLCVLKIEIDSSMNYDQSNEQGAVSSEHPTNPRVQRERDQDRGLRNTTKITIESYINKQMDSTTPRGVLPTNSRETTPLEESQAASEFPTEIGFFSGNPYVEVTKGLIHLYKKNERKEIKDPLSNQLCLLAVPTSLSCHDLVKFVAPCHSVIQHIRIIRDGSPNQYMVLLEFRNNDSALEFYQTFNGAAYNSLEPDSLCHAVWVSNIEWGDDGTPPLGHTELPTCPVCLERMDESVDGVLTILCNHAFHANCLKKWGDSTCPVCRHVQTPELLENSVCMECEGTEALWICLLCGHVGCGRYQGGHAASHYRATNHTYAMQLGTSSVWDYAGDNFVHRLFQNKSDGKLVATQSPGKEGDEKIDSMQLEFTYLLTSQLDTQRKYYEEKLIQLENLIHNESRNFKTKTDTLVQKCTTLEQKLQVLTKEKANLEKKMAQNSAKLKETQKELAEEKEMGKALQTNQSSWQLKYNSLEKIYKDYQVKMEHELEDLKEQSRDIMFYMQAQSVIAGSELKDEIAGGSVIVPEVEAAAAGTGSKSKARRKKKHEN